MKKYNQHLPEGKTVYVGLDLHRAHWHVTVLCEEETLFSGAQPPEAEKLLSFLARYRPHRIEAVYEAGCFGFTLYEQLTRAGIGCTVTPPTLVPLEYGNHVKTDRRDSHKLAYFLSKGLLKAVWVPEPEACAERQLLRRRQQLVSHRVRVQQQIKSQLCLFGLRVEQPRGPWTQRFFHQLQGLAEDNSAFGQSLQALLSLYQEQGRLIEQQDQLLKELATSARYAEPVRLLRTIPGIGRVSALSLVLELGDVGRFGRAEQLAAYVGLTPAQYSSGQKIRMGRITRCGKSQLRALLTEVAWTAIRQDPELRAVYERLKFRRGAKRAIVAVTRRLLLRCRRVLLDGRAYRPSVAA